MVIINHNHIYKIRFQMSYIEKVILKFYFNGQWNCTINFFDVMVNFKNKIHLINYMKNKKESLG